MVWSDVANHRGIYRICEHYQRIISDFESVLSARKCSRHDDVGISRTDQKTEFLERHYLIAEQHQRTAQLAFAFRCGRFERVLVFNFFQTVFGRGKVRVRRRRLFGPAIAGEWLEICCHTSPNRHSVRIRAVGIDIHVRLEQERLAMALWVLQLQNGLAIEKIMPGQNLIEMDEIVAQHFHLCVVKLSE